MKYIYVTLLVLFFSITDTFPINFYPGAYKEALTKAKVEHKNLLLYFTATWCGPCQYMQQNIFPDREITAYVDAHYIALKIDIDSEAGKRLYFKFEHEGVPDFYIITPDELILQRSIGGMKVNQLKSFLALEKAVKPKAQVLSDSVATILLDKAEQTIADFAVTNPELANRLEHKRAKSDSAANAGYADMVASRKKGFTAFFNNARLSKWQPGLSVGASLNNFHGDLMDGKVIPGYQVGVLLNHTTKRIYIQPELQFTLRGGGIGGESYRIHSFELPLTFGYRIGWHRLIDGKQAIWVNAIPYGGYSISGKSALLPAATTFNPWSYGVKGGISLSMGSFLPAFGYDVGLASLDKSRLADISTRGYYVSFALIIGK